MTENGQDIPVTATTMTTRRAADRLGKTVRQLHYLIDLGRLVPVEQLDGKRGTYVFDPADVERLRAALLAEAEANVARLSESVAS